MVNSLTVTALNLPDRSDRMPQSLPAWVASRVETLRDEPQKDKEGKWRTVKTIPAALILGSSERRNLEQYADRLADFLKRTPVESADAEAELIVLIAKMMMSLPGQKTGDDGAEASAEAYSAALDDIPPWAVAGALRRWYRGDVKVASNELRPNFDFRPSPARLRSIAFFEASGVRGQIDGIRALLSAEARVVYTNEHRKEMLEKLQNAVPRIQGEAP